MLLYARSAHRVALLLLVVTAMFVDTAANPGVVFASHAEPRGWTLPFQNPFPIGPSVWITNAPGVGTHTGWNAFDIDYAPPNPSTLYATAPADGVVLDYTVAQGTFGNVLRLQHNGVVSFFAHLAPDTLQVSPGQTIVQGQPLATIGDTGSPGALHLHFGARVGAVAGQPLSGVGTAITALPGNWFYDCYAPPPNLTWCPVDANQVSWNGVAQSPATVYSPPWADLGRNLRLVANELSPGAISPSLQAPAVDNSVISLAWGGNPGVGFNGTWFQILRYCPSCGAWQVLANTTGNIGLWPKQEQPNDDYVIYAFAAFQQSTWSSVDVMYSTSTGGGAPFIASYMGNTNAGGHDGYGALHVGQPGKTWLQVNVSGAGGGVFYFGSVLGSDAQIGKGNYGAQHGSDVITGNCYAAVGWDGVNGWGQWSPWLCPN